MRKIRILHITHAHGGIKTFIENIVNFSDNEIFEHFIVGTDVVLNYDNNFKKKQDIFIDRRPNPFRDIVSLIKIIVYIRKNEPDIIHCHSAKGGFIGRLASKFTGKKCVYTPHAFSYLGFRGIKRNLYILLEKITKNITDLLLAVSNSEAIRAELEIGYQRKNIKIIANSIQIPSYNDFKVTKKLMKVGMIGRLIYQKNPIMFLKVALFVHNDFPNIQFELLGAGYQDYLSREVSYFINKNKMEKYCSITKWDTTNNRLNDFYNSLSIFLLTSNFEGLPYSLVESMARGIPCIVTDADGNRDVINDGDNGFIVPCDDAESMAEKVKELLCNEALYKQFSIRGYETVLENHNIKKNISKYEDVYLKLYNNELIIKT